ncbi:MAG: exodeoxyribonuclease VII small subunit [Carbonactinosporaceae bacterium]
MVEEQLGYEQARDELTEVVRRLESGGVTLEESLALWERGEQLAGICQRWLDGARARLDAVAGEPGSTATNPTDATRTPNAPTKGDRPEEGR